MFNAVGQDDWRRRIGQERRKDDEEDQAGRHERPLVQAFFGDVEDTVLPEDIARRREDMDAHREDDDDPQGLQGLEDEFHRQAGNGKTQGDESRDQGI